MKMPRFRAYIASSLDGFIATADGGVDWLDPFNGLDYGYDAFYAEIGMVVMGRKSFDLAASVTPWTYAGKPSIVLSRRPAPGDVPPDTRFTDTPVAQLADELAGDAEGDIWVMGGGDVIRQFIDAGRLDRFELFVMPVLLGRGIRLFPDGAPTDRLTLQGARPYRNGVVGLTWRLR